jgi:general secretion pathway protein D
VYIADQQRDLDVHDKVSEIDLSPRSPQSVGNSANPLGAALRPTTYMGTSSSPSRDPSVPASTQGTTQANAQSGGAAADGDVTPTADGYVFNFENAPVAAVAKVTLGDLLNVGYSIDPRVQGNVSLSSGRAVPNKDLLYVLENALRMSNVVLVRDGRGYRLIPAGEAVGTGGVDGAGATPEAGYGLSVLPLKNVSAQSLMKIMDSFAVKPGMVRADVPHNMLIFQGTAAERQSALKAAFEFDADWMKSQSVGIYPVNSAAPEVMIAEMEKIMQNGEGGLGQDMVKFVPVARMNAILVVSRKPDLLVAAGNWIKRLDRSDITNTGVRVYRVKYGEARVLAAILNDVLVGQTGALDAASSQIAPGSGLDRLSSGGGGGFAAGGFGSGTGSGSGLGASSATPTSPGATSLTSPTSPSSTPGGGFGTASTAQRPGMSTAGGLGGVYGGVSSGAGGGTGRAGILEGVRITPDVINNAILIYANQENYRLIEHTLRELDRPQLQVAIEATIAEVTLNNTLAFGVQYFLKAKNNQGSAGLFGPTSVPTTTTTSTDTTSVASTATSLALQRVLPGFNLLVGKEADPRAILDTLRTITDVKVLSSPSLVVIDNQPAILQVGDQVPIATTSAANITNPNTPIVNNIDYRNTGIILRVVPRINVNGNITLNVEQESSNVVQNLASATTLTPTVSQRRVKSSVAVASGQTVVLAGLITDKSEDDKTGIPGVMSIPGLGTLFGHDNTQRQRTELIVFIKPQIIRDSLDAYTVATELRAKLMGSARPYAGAPLRPELSNKLR